MKFFLHHVIGWKPWKGRGSRWREVMTRAILVFSACLIAEAAVETSTGHSSVWPPIAVLFALLSTGFFIYQILAVPLSTTQQFQIDARRLFRDTLISGLFMIMSYSLVYRTGGIIGSDVANALDHVYFSAVTFSTLGYGDFRPDGTSMRLLAAAQAIIGNLHLAVLVGAVFLRMSRRTPDKIS